MSGAQRQRRPKTPAQRKREQRARDDALATSELDAAAATSRFLKPWATICAGPASCLTTAEDDPATIARGVEALLAWLVDHADDQPVSR